MERSPPFDDLATAAPGSVGWRDTVKPHAALARRADFPLGNATIRPSVRTIIGPEGTATAEPRVMQVLLAFVDAGGAVLTRDDLMSSCWRGQIVGDDSVNRSVAEVRRLARETAAGFTIQTIPRIGYRLTTDERQSPETLEADASAAEPARAPALTRRGALYAATSIVVAGVGAGWWWIGRDRPDPRTTSLVEQARSAMRSELPDGMSAATGLLQKAIAIEPERPDAWGLLALAHRDAAEYADPADRSAALARAERAITRALLLDPAEGNALAARAMLQPRFGDWIDAEDRLRAVLAVAPDNIAANSGLEILLQAAGRTRASLRLSERITMLDPLSPAHRFRQAIKLWTVGRLADAELAIERAMRTDPRHPAVWNTRLFLFAFTNRIDAASAMLNDSASRPPSFEGPPIERWRVSLQALRTRSPADIRTAREVLVRDAIVAPGPAVNAIMVLSVLEEVDAAFDVANGYLLRRGPLIGELWTGHGEPVINDQQERKTMMLFVPATTAMRADRRFLGLCEAMGMVRYWRARGIRPDYLMPATV